MHKHFMNLYNYSGWERVFACIEMFISLLLNYLFIVSGIIILNCKCCFIYIPLSRYSRHQFCPDY